MATSKRARAKAAKVKAAEAAKAAWDKALKAEMSAGAEAVRAAMAAKEKAGEADEAARIAAAKAQAAEEAAETAEAMAEEAAKARAVTDEMRRRREEEAAGWAQCEEERFAATFRRHWNQLFAYSGVRTFHQTTSIPAMRYTYPAAASDDGRPKAMDGLQIVSVKIASIKEPLLHWPLQVFGVVAARDVLDHRRNIVFHRPRNDCQTMTQEDPYLALTGPGRAIAVSTDLSYVEVSLKVKGATRAEDRDLSELVVMYRVGCYPRGVYPSRLSTLELKFDRVARSVEATIRVKLKGCGSSSWPLGFRAVLFTAAVCASGDDDDGINVKLLDYSGNEDGGLPMDADGVIKLSRRVVSAGLDVPLKISVMASSIREDQRVVECDEATFKPERDGISVGEIGVGFCSMEVTVAWSCFRYE